MGVPGCVLQRALVGAALVPDVRLVHAQLRVLGHQTVVDQVNLSSAAPAQASLFALVQKVGALDVLVNGAFGVDVAGAVNHLGGHVTGCLLAQGQLGIIQKCLEIGSVSRNDQKPESFVAKNEGTRSFDVRNT